MGREPDAVPGPMPEVIAVPGRRDDLAGHSVDGASRRGTPSPPALATADSSATIAAGVPERRVVDGQVPRRRLPDEQGPGHVAAIAGDLRAEVEQEDRAVADRPIARRAMGQRRLRAGQAGDVEGQGLRPAGPHRPLEAEREVGFGPDRTDVRQERGQRPVGDRAGGGDPLELGGLLDRPIGLHPALDRDELDVRGGGGEPHPAACDTNPASTPTRRAPSDATSSGQRSGRSP